MTIRCLLVFVLVMQGGFAYDPHLTILKKRLKFAILSQPEVADLFLKIYKNEKAHPEFIQCVTAQNSFFYAYQVIAKELYLS